MIEPAVAAERAHACWTPLAAMLRPGRRGVAVIEPGRGPAAAWPTSQVLVAALLRGRVAGDLSAAEGLIAGLERFRRGDAYADVPAGWWTWRRRVYVDDNAWLGLAGILAGRLDLSGGSRAAAADVAARALRVVRTGEEPGGGVRWVADRPGVHACSTGPGGCLAAWVGGADDLALAGRCAGFLRERLTLADGLVADRIRLDGSIEPTVWAYNQGSALHLDLLLWRRGADPAGLDRARARAALVRDRLLADATWLWAQPPVFVAVLGRALCALDAEASDAEAPGAADAGGGWAALLDPYLDRAWREARQPDGYLRGGGIGRYDATRALDQAGFVQLYALRADPSIGDVIT